MKLSRLAWQFLRIGSTGFGGPMALIGLMQERLVEKEQAVTAEDFTTGVALGQTLPGPIAVDCATHIGYRLRGVAGAVVTTVALIAPAFLVMLILTPLYFKYGRVPHVEGFFRGVGAAVVAVILSAGIRLGQKSLRAVAPAVIAVAAFAGTLAHLHPVLLILGAGALGLVFFRPRPASEEPDETEDSGEPDEPKEGA
jgi:chromate transporter